MNWNKKEEDSLLKQSKPQTDLNLKSKEEEELIPVLQQVSHEDKMELALWDIWLDEPHIAKKLMEIMESAFTSTPEWQIIPDFKTMLDAIKVWQRFKKKGPDTVVNIANVFWDSKGML